MTDAYYCLAMLVLMAMAAGLVLIKSSAAPADGVLAVQLSGTAGAAILLILAAATGVKSLLDVAVVYALLAAGLMIVFVKVRSRQDLK
jgi:multicomponent Na+:H+ antiporter subunit F